MQFLEKAATISGRSSPAPDPLSENSHHRTMSALSSGTTNSFNGLTLSGQGSTLNTSGTMLNRQYTHSKDPKARAKSREYLKQCLQEISYLTSASSLNPLPDRAVNTSTAVNGSTGAGSIRPKKVLSEFAPPASWSGDASNTTAAGGAMRRQRNLEASRGGASAKGGSTASVGRGLQLFDQPLVEKDEEGITQLGETDEIPTENSLALDTESLIEGASDSASSSSLESEPLSVGSSQDFIAEDHATNRNGLMEDLDDKKQITAVFRPGGQALDGDDWAKLKDAGIREREKREQSQNYITLDGKEDDDQLGSNDTKAIKSEEQDLASLTLANENDEDTNRLAAEAAAEGQMWRSKRVLRSHLDAVRAVVFDNTELSLYSASDDNTIKYWRLDPSTFTPNKMNNAAPSIDSEPIVTLRGHSAAVTSLAISTSKKRLYSGSVDSSIVVWKLVDGNHTEAYPPFDKSMELTRLVGHTQAIWDLCLLPAKNDAEGILASASADGTVKFWTADSSSLILSFDYFGSEPTADKEEERATILAEKDSLPVPTSIAPCHSDLRKCAVSYSNAVVKLFDIKTGKEVMQFTSDTHYDGTEASQINKVLTHPTLPVLITGHENNYIKFFDMNTGTCTLSMVAHLDSVTCLDMDPSGLTLASGGHDCSVRYWDYDSEKNTAVCVQEVTAHRKKVLSSEGVLQVKYHPTAPWFCSAGADGAIRLYG